MSVKIDSHDTWLKQDGPAALVLRQHLESVEGADGVIFPATYAPAEDSRVFPGGYNIDTFPDGTNVCLMDSVGSQANRIEPAFGREPYTHLVPQIIIEAGEIRVNLLEAGHRAGDAIVRCSSLQEELRDAFLAAQKGDALPMAKIAPTSLVFGVWDSRDTQTKMPRLVTSAIRAFNVRKLTRSAQFNPAVAFVEKGLLENPEGDDKLKKKFAERGFIHVPSSGSHGGVIATGGVRRDACLSLAALRLLKSPSNDLDLKRYVLGLGLVAITLPQEGYLRSGCNLVPSSEKPLEFNLVHADGNRTPAGLSHEHALAYAKLAAEAVGVGKSRTVPFDQKKAKDDVSDDTKAKKGKKAKPAETAE